MERPRAKQSMRCKSAGYYFGHDDAFCERAACRYKVSTIDTMLSNFIIPLQMMADTNSRVHCSLNLNTETGRLSARRPSLQNQPAIEKDRYGVRKAFMASPGNKLIVADYGQLELRLLAHMTRCKSMLEAFKAGGDFHSRTAMGMYPHVAEAVQKGAVLLEWDEHKGEPPVPLLKNVFNSERRKAKILNFSIAYGKTAMGLAKDWNVSLGEAKDTLEKWYSDRPEVRQWQQQVLVEARREKATRTLFGRYRDLPDIVSSQFRHRGHAERAAINTPIQGGAADVAMMAMLKVWRNARLKQLGWKMLLQIHDEIIVEGPAESANEALALVLADMQHPFENPLLVDLVVDAKIADNWYDAK
jgi:DNA polymerase-1